MFKIEKELKDTYLLCATESTSLDYFRIMTGKISLYYAAIIDILNEIYYFVSYQVNIDPVDVDLLVGTQLLNKIRNIENMVRRTIIQPELYKELINLFNGRNLIIHRGVVWIMANENESDVKLRKLYLKMYMRYVEAYKMLKETNRKIR